MAVAGVGVWLVWGRAHSKEVGSAQARAESTSAVPSVKVVRPRAGGIPRTIQQPAIMHAFESVDLYAMVSGYLKSQAVDIGSRIKKGEVLAEINVPRDAKAYDEAAALVGTGEGADRPGRGSDQDGRRRSETPRRPRSRWRKPTWTG